MDTEWTAEFSIVRYLDSNPSLPIFWEIECINFLRVKIWEIFMIPSNRPCIRTTTNELDYLIWFRSFIYQISYKIEIILILQPYFLYEIHEFIITSVYIPDKKSSFFHDFEYMLDSGVFQFIFTSRTTERIHLSVFYTLPTLIVTHIEPLGAGLLRRRGGDMLWRPNRWVRDTKMVKIWGKYQARTYSLRNNSDDESSDTVQSWISVMVF